ncbi:MAG TPA: protein-L-isoaspartate(D-aspartate) O-methyltransferase [Terriglobales bacterium]|nr:protein-L-isoaspartate(D-aspartate) O-methyltransferase [Terriglobales bacterium]
MTAIWLSLAAVVLLSCDAAPGATPSNADYAGARARLLAELRAGGIRDARVLSAIERVPRHELVRAEDLRFAYDNRPLPIGGGQTISQPTVVAMMTELLELDGSERVLEIGTGSGYQAAVLSLLAKEVYSVELLPELATKAKGSLQRLGYDNVQVRAGDGFFGWPEAAPFDAIIVTAAAPRVPEKLVAQLAEGGTLVMPRGEGGEETLIRLRKRAGKLETERIAAVAFVPMRGAILTPTPGR